MDNINDLVNAAMEQWDEETNCGETDPAFAGEVGQEIDALVDGLSKEKVTSLLNTDAPIMFVEGPRKPWPTGTYETRNYLGKVVCERGPKVFTIYDSRDNIIAHLDYDLASLVAHIFEVVSEEGTNEQR